MFTNRKSLVLLIVLILIILVRIVSYYYSPTKFKINVEVEGFVASTPVAKFNKLSFKLESYWVTADYIDISVGDKVKVWGKVEKTRLTAEKIEIIDSRGLQGSLIRFREGLISRINSHLPMKESGLLAGILLGSKDTLSREIKDKLITTGTLHIVVVSGYNIVLVASFFLVFARYLGRKKTTLLAFVAIGFYSLLVGLEPPTLRALVMGSIALLAVLLGRQSAALYSLIVACSVMLLINPANLTDISFQLTVSATFGIIVFTQPLVNLFRWAPTYFRNTLASTLAAQILVLPLIFYYFGNIPLISPIVNTLVLWVIPLTTLFGFFFLTVTFVSSFLANVFSTLLYLPLKYFFLVIELFSRLEFLELKFAQPSLLIVVGYYLVVLAVVLRFRGKIFTKATLDNVK